MSTAQIVVGLLFLTGIVVAGIGMKVALSATSRESNRRAIGYFLVPLGASTGFWALSEPLSPIPATIVAWSFWIAVVLTVLSLVILISMSRATFKRAGTEDS